VSWNFPKKSRLICGTFLNNGEVPMSSKIFDLIVAKEIEVNQGGVREKRTLWNKVGMAWPTKSSEALSIEFFFIPNVRYVLVPRDSNQGKNQSKEMEAQVGGAHE
jgi:hypothetical protein